MSNELRLGLLGLGTVGQGVVNVLSNSGAEIERRLGMPIRVTAACVRDLDAARECDTSGIMLTADPAAVIDSPDVDVVIELMGGLDPTDALVSHALRAGKSVVTANKALIAERGNALFALAQEHNVALAFEAAVAGGIPIIKALREGLAANRIDSVAGIINGTCNYILTRMQTEGASFGDVLDDAQRLGYAEADPTFDIDGVDAAHKLAILGSIAFGTPLAFERMVVEGIRDVRTRDAELADEFGYRIKHLGLAKRVADGIELRVHATLVPKDHMLAGVNGVLNAVMLSGDAVGSTGHTGPGAGSLATASAVLADVIDVGRGIAGRVPPLGYQPERVEEMPVVAREAIESAYYLRLEVADQPGVLRAITSILADREISIEAILQKEPRVGQDATVALITSETREATFDAAVAEMLELPSVREGLSRFRVDHFEQAS